MESQLSVKRFPALQAQIGDWDYYITTLTFEEVARRVQPATRLVTSSDMNYWIQRRVMPRRARQIASYLIEQEQHFFPGIVVGVYLGEPTWYEVNIDDNPIFGSTGLDPESRGSLGLLELDGTEKLYAIDGQHRVAGIREALKRLWREDDLDRYNQLANEKLSIAFVSADKDEPGGLERVRRLFTTLNKQAKRVSEPEIVALDEDDSAAIVTRWIATHYDGLRTPCSSSDVSEYNLLQLGRTHDIRPRNRRSITTIVTLYRMVKNIFQQELRILRKKYGQNRPDDVSLEEMYQETVLIWELMRQYDEAISDVLGSDPSEERAGKHRSERGGHILFRPIGLQAFSGALGLLRMRGVDNECAVKNLLRLPMDINRVPWQHVVWNPNTHSMITANKPVTEALFLHMLGQEPRTAGYPLDTRYIELIGSPTTDPFEQIPVHGLE